VIFHDEAMKHESVVYQFHSICQALASHDILGTCGYKRKSCNRFLLPCHPFRCWPQWHQEQLPMWLRFP
jgi:hypothetical protein